MNVFRKLFAPLGISLLLASPAFAQQGPGPGPAPSVGSPAALPQKSTFWYSSIANPQGNLFSCAFLVANTAFAVPIYISGSGAITDIGFVGGTTPTANHAKMAILADNGGKPGATLGQLASPITASTSTAANNTGALSAAVPVTIGWYWLAIITDGTINSVCTAGDQSLARQIGSPSATGPNGIIVTGAGSTINAYTNASLTYAGGLGTFGTPTALATSVTVLAYKMQ